MVIHHDELGIHFWGEYPQLHLVGVLADKQVIMEKGSLHISRLLMDDDLVVENGECFVGIDIEHMTEEQDDLHVLFGEIDGGQCE